MEKLIVSAAILFALGSVCACAGETDDEPEQQVQQPLNGIGNGTNRGGVASPGVENGAPPKGNLAAHRPPQTAQQYDDSTQGVEGH